MKLSKNVLFLESSKNIGGQELQLLQQMQELNLLGWSTRLLCKYDSRIYDHALSLGLDVERAAFKNALHLPSIFWVIDQLRQLKPRVLLCHSGHDAIVGSLAARIWGLFNVRPKIVRMRTYQPNIPKSFSYNYLFDKTYTPSAYLREKILSNKAVKPCQIDVLYPGINFSKIENANDCLPQQLSEWLGQNPGFVISHGAMLRGEKGHEIILRALPQVISRVPCVRYIIAGEGPQKNHLKALVHELNLSEHVYFAGMVESIGALLKKSDLAILPSLMESLGMFQIESQYLKVPTIASDIDGVPETLIHEKTGLLVPAGNVDAWAENLIWALNNLEVMRSWAGAGKCYVSKKFSMEKNTQNLLEIISG